MKYIYLIALSAIIAFSGTTASNANLARQPWVKICGTPTYSTTRNCLVMHDKVGRRYGGFTFSAVVRKIKGRKDVFFLTFPKGYDLKRGIHFAIDKNKPFSFYRYSCKKRRCTAAAILTRKFKAQLLRGKRMVVLVYRSGRPVGFRVTLKGFTAAYKGRPVNSRAYFRARQREARRVQDRNGIVAPPTTFDEIFKSF